MKDRLIAADNILWNNVILGDQQAYRELYEMYADMLFRYGLRYIKDTSTIKDCIQELFTSLYHYRSNLAHDVNIRFYLLRSFRRKIHQAVKKNATILHTVNAEDYFSIVYEPDAEQLLIAAEQQQEMLRLLARELNELPARQKEVLFLKFNCNLSYEEVAGIMKISVPTCRTLAYRAFRQLRANMEKVPVLPLMILLMSWISREHP
ncbi:RNA polymerase sigma factor [Chitinophaga sp. CC14]|uniref:RNA polymerase sigma factor n=1 Tax=Chitinophaga TaxID=79328 RepID=UPI000DB9F23B|nr:RNA polymerase sigma factor [Chitinophaga ginsengisegetis]MDR6568849.1 RNA polymerase sigma factor (sigma-70 family) [Chitinophaga ginsengisegetis]MDR6649121.1 RNA polymerase sigma factor (sigma-70 family) [Chitinophaga ginsengisegetis]MDR6654930.1 RNA polymerase sigma factor (sigma-70 family) [Chitinophaga ginsengisegetis]